MGIYYSDTCFYYISEMLLLRIFDYYYRANTFM